MHEQFLLAALEQAKLGQGQCAPNPCVGAVAVQSGKIIAQAYHQGAGTPHAEQLLLAQLPPKMLGVSVYITLEPCNHWGRTPPCVNALIDYGVERVYFAYFDPNPLVANNDSSALLRQHGIRVEHLSLEEINVFYRAYEQWINTGKPRVTVKIAQSLDGKIGARKGERILLSNELCQQFTHEMRACSDVILTTAKTIQADNPQLNVRLNGKEKAKPVAILDTNLTLDEALIFSTASECHIYHQETVAPPIDKLAHCHYYAIPAQDDGLNLECVISHLGKLGYHNVWVEAGGALFSSLHQERLVDRTYLYLTPTYLGENTVSAYKKEGLFRRKHQVSWQVMGNNMILCLDWQEDKCLPV
ncbi:bifunctional diaminohydroxyphosphoribosylaminopyrimidine deaminase/5-amino-6-(5-phosphoribosylamino)uracil reductase RibD [Legionella sp. km772]|uniref:bifunctional diaminohydroxyphosphoribosylaminopyrimidine deaminase/5-amino-6-(5-phosphoribosylamino)uracil reductase RibD n=1 Tax=Legionella sp. km772 TaxID=2498111 RepID=UPI000F8C929A|nr:bifunctional diaminohydroxyphosphoribosylaminopyrimidine deaminase/5-amino-6-(5-phosphoribosylamino)uracil reductase RibD [Legionella sp. km772]RUR10845.1 bifunctional diaminohydroxyphosphoribosylaminopyrimidine deaminase/5-amino-6-(5-phosphoribosylamino)uracil reductase RibD [Legionella sp. km772]